jgi:glutamine amidotransferase
MRVAIVDYGLGNLRSVTKAFAKLGADAVLTGDPADLDGAAALVLPGVGAFGDGMAGLQQRDLVEPLRAAAKSGKPILGICLGLQLFFEKSSEAPGVPGLGLLAGEVVRFEGPAFGAKGWLKVPHMGWNTLTFARAHPVFQGLPENPWVYFVHSYYVNPAAEADTIATSDYGRRFCAGAGAKRIVGTQFHPEKSQTLGLKMLENFLAWAGRGA